MNGMVASMQGAMRPTCANIPYKYGVMYHFRSDQCNLPQSPLSGERGPPSNARSQGAAQNRAAVHDDL